MKRAKMTNDNGKQLAIWMQSNPQPWCRSHGHIGPPEPHRQWVHSHVTTAAHICQLRLEVAILAILTNSYLLENS